VTISRQLQGSVSENSPRLSFATADGRDADDWECRYAGRYFPIAVSLD
jgi:hypothetical protein